MDCLNKNRAEAIKNNESKYFNEIPCKNGGVGIKTIHGRCLCEICNKIRYEKLKAYRKLNPQKHGKQSKVWAEKNKEKVSKYQKEWKATNKEKINLNKKQWDKNNKEIVARYSANNRAKRKNAIPKWFGEIDEFIISEAFDLALKRSKLTGIKWHVDHMIPLNAKNACGLHCGINIQVIPDKMNFYKNNRMIFTNPNEWVKGI